MFVCVERKGKIKTNFITHQQFLGSFCSWEYFSKAQYTEHSLRPLSPWSKEKKFLNPKCALVLQSLLTLHLNRAGMLWPTEISVRITAFLKFRNNIEVHTRGTITRQLKYFLCDRTALQKQELPVFRVVLRVAMIS